MKKYFLHSIIIFGLLFLFNPIKVLSQIPHLTYGNLKYSDETIPQEITFTAYISSRSNEKLTESSSGCSYYPDSGIWVVQCSSFPSGWNAGETLIINFYDDEGGTGSDEIILSYNPFDNGELTIMSRPKFQITISTNPSGLKFYADNFEYTSPHTFSWELYSIHNLSVYALQYPENNRGCIFSHWSHEEEKDHEYQVQKSNQTLTAFFNEIFYLKIKSNHGNPQGDGWYDKNQDATISVHSRDITQNSRYTFTNWSGDKYSTDTSLVITMDQPKTMIANWDTEHYLKINSPNGNPQGEGWYSKNSQASFSVISPDVNGQTRYIFQNWIGDYSGQNTNGSIFMDTSKTINAEWKTQYYLSLDKNPDQGGSTTPTPPGQWTDSNQQIQLSATPTTDYLFSEWSGDISTNNNPTSINMTKPNKVTANFLKIVNITIKTNPANMTIIVDGEQYTAPETFEWIENSIHNISVNSPEYTAKDTRYIFNSWNNGAEQTQNYMVTDQNETLICSLTKQYHLTVDSEHGYPKGTGWYDANSYADYSVTTPDLQGATRYIFTRWSGNVSNTIASGSILMNNSKTISASWEIQYYLTVRNSGHGSVTGEGWYNIGQTATFSVNSTTVPEGEGTRYIFSGWEGSGTGSYTGEDQSHSLVMNNPIIEKVEWTLQYFLSTHVNPDLGGNIIPAPPGFWYNANSQAEVKAIPANSYQFLFWTGDILGTNNPTSINIISPTSVIANFSQTIEVTISTNPAGLTFTADGKQYTAPYKFTWAKNSIHTIKADSLYNINTGIRYEYNNWSDGREREHVFTVPDVNTIITADYKLQYYLTINSNYGNPKGERWYYAGEKAGFSVDQLDIQGFTKKIFNRWSGDFSGYSTADSLTMSRPKTITPIWNTEYFIELISDHGITSGQGWYSKGSSISFAVTPVIQTIGDTIKYIFIKWKGTGNGSYTGTDNSSTIILNNPIIEKASWETQYFLSTSVEPEDGGKIVPSSPGNWIDENLNVTISASAKNEYFFSHWAGDIEGDINPTTISMDSPKQIKAIFGLKTGITIDTNPTSLKFIADNIEYSAPQTFMWTEHTTHTISVNSPQDPDAFNHYEFSSWSNGKPQEHTYIVPTNQDTLIANFQTYYYLTVNSIYGSPKGDGWYKKGSTAQISINKNVDLDLNDQSRKIFNKWQGDYSGTDTLAYIKMNSPKTISATWKTQYYVDVISERGTTYGQGWYTENTNAIISVNSPIYINSTMRYIFSEWKGTGQGSYSGNSLSPSIIVKNPIIEIAVWDKQYHIQTSVIPEWGGEIKFFPPGNWHKAEIYVSVTAVPDTTKNYIFSSWSGDLISNKNPDSLYIDSSKIITAHFNTTENTIITTEPPGLPITVDSITYVSPKYFTWSYGTSHSISVPITYTPNNDVQYHYQYWNDQGERTHTINVGKNNAYKAIFKTQYYLHTQVNPSNGGNVSPSTPGSWFDEGVMVTIIATPFAEYTFSKWSGNINSTTNPVSTTMNKSKSVIAHFDKSTDIEKEINSPDKFILWQNYPNPFNPETTISYQIPTSGYVKLEILNTKGQTIRILVDTYQKAGTHKITWGGRDDFSCIVSSGIYYYILRNDNNIKIKKLLFLK